MELIVLKGKLIVIEGLEGSGKSTQIGLLSEKLKGRSIHRIKLPDYDSPSSSLVKMYLSGEFGSEPGDVNPYAASAFYAVDRYANYKTKWKRFYDDGFIIIADRYTPSNVYHQATKLDQNERPGFYKWLVDFEYGQLGIPEPDAVIYLDMPIDISQRMLTGRYSGDESRKDIHEVNVNYLNKCRKVALDAAKELGWMVVECSADDQPRSREDISSEVYLIVKKELNDV